jgi:hypothetical protein
MGRKIGIICSNMREGLQYIKEIELPQIEAYLIYKVDHLRSFRKTSLDFVITLSENYTINDHLKSMNCSSIKEYLSCYA